MRPAELVASEIRFIVPERRSVWALLDMETFKDPRRQIRSANAETCNLFVGRELFESVGGFDDSLPEHGDFDFAARCVAARARLVFAPEAVVRHPTRNSARPFPRTLWGMHPWYAAPGKRPRPP